jgi:hypothetical protein
LKFIIEDGEFGDLSGLELLPVANGDFLVFCPNGPHVYIIDEERRKLLPSLEHMMVSADLETHLEEKLRSAPCCGKFIGLSHIRKLALRRKTPSYHDLPCKSRCN